MWLFFSAETLSEDDDDVVDDNDGLSISMPSYTGFIPSPGGPFSALTSSMWPQDVIQSATNPVRKVKRILTKS